VTQGQFEQVMGNNNPSVFRDVERREDHPVENVSWEEAVEFCRRLSELPEEKKAGRRYRLPTEAEWEYACRAGKQGKPFSTGNSLTPGEANIYIPPPPPPPMQPPAKEHHQPPTVPVGSYSPNAWGLYDMHGNVWEWCSDWYDHNYYRVSPRQDPQGPESGSTRVMRGGSRASLPPACRSANRANSGPRAGSGIGFRVVLVEGD
jgi:formylglycine-generating enzyme required for sulfatase activity